jgi:RimJ/RimL family protein N-acetyltransferase
MSGATSESTPRPTSGQLMSSALTDGIVTLRGSTPSDVPALLAGRDDQRRRFLGVGSDEPQPTFCIVAEGEVAGWVDYDRDADHSWLGIDEVNVGYELFPSFRGRGLATRALQLMLHHLAVRGEHRVASLLIDPANAPSLALATRAGYVASGEIGDQRYFRRDIPPLRYTDGVVEIRAQRPDDLERHLSAIDEAQIDWLWLPGDRELWEAMTPERQRERQLEYLRMSQAAFGQGPKWRFSVDAGEERYVAYVDCDLANPDVPPGEANIAYVTHPSFRRRGFATRAVLLVLAFLADHTGAREAHLVIDAENDDSIRVADGVGSYERERFAGPNGRVKVRYVIEITRPRQQYGQSRKGCPERE